MTTAWSLPTTKAEAEEKPGTRAALEEQALVVPMAAQELVDRGAVKEEPRQGERQGPAGVRSVGKEERMVVPGWLGEPEPTWGDRGALQEAEAMQAQTVEVLALAG